MTFCKVGPFFMFILTGLEVENCSVQSLFSAVKAFLDKNQRHIIMYCSSNIRWPLRFGCAMVTVGVGTSLVRASQQWKHWYTPNHGF
jgi:hypothetical protein